MVQKERHNGKRNADLHHFYFRAVFYIKTGEIVGNAF